MRATGGMVCSRRHREAVQKVLQLARIAVALAFAGGQRLGKRALAIGQVQHGDGFSPQSGRRPGVGLRGMAGRLAADNGNAAPIDGHMVNVALHEQ